MLVGQLGVSMGVGALALATTALVGFGVLEAMIAYAVASPAAMLALATRAAVRSRD